MKKHSHNPFRPAAWMGPMLACVALSMAGASLSAQTPDDATKHFSKPDRIRYDGHCFTIDGKDIFIRSAAFHYFRTPRELWRDRFQKIKDAGFNAVDTYVPWNWHERGLPDGLNDFSKVDLSELEAWLKMAQDEFGFYTIVRPGPFICAEWGGGGYPRWLAKFNPRTGKEFWLRSGDDAHIAWSVHWYDAVCKVFAREQVTRKPKGGKGVILVQIENEYDHHKDPEKTKVLRALYEAVKKAGIEVPIFTCLTRECRASKDPQLSQVFDSDNYYVAQNAAPSCAERMASLRASQPDAPGFVTELQGGWFSLVGGSLSEEHFSDARHYNAISLMSLLGGAAGLNTYMFVGGTNFGGWQARGQTTSYDYNAPIREPGALSPKYRVAKAVNEFIRENQEQLLRSEGGPCKLRGAPANLFGGIRVGPDGTRFVFLANTDPAKSVSGKATVVPGKNARPAEPAYNIDQEGNRVLIKTDAAAAAQPPDIPPFEVSCDLGPLGAKVLVIPPGKTPAEGTWCPKTPKPAAPPALPAAVRLETAFEKNDPLDGKWRKLTDGKSLPELGVSDQRYALYRARFTLPAGDVQKLTKLLVNSFSRDIVSAQVNGRIPPRLYPSDAYAAAATRNKETSFTRIGPNDFDNRFDVAGLLRVGSNEIVLLYENIGHEHGYIPMEELSGIRRAGLSGTEATLDQPLDWEAATDLGGVTSGWTNPDFVPQGWNKVALDTKIPVPRKGNDLQPKAKQDALLTWYRLEFDLPDSPEARSVPWRLLIKASGNGFLWLNGHDVGRHWEKGPQREFYLPECWLKFGGRNVLVLGLRQTIHGAKIEAAEIAPYPEVPESNSR
jgi:hypothetical protein